KQLTAGARESCQRREKCPLKFMQVVQHAVQPYKSIVFMTRSVWPIIWYGLAGWRCFSGSSFEVLEFVRHPVPIVGVRQRSFRPIDRTEVRRQFCIQGDVLDLVLRNIFFGENGVGRALG